MGEPIVARRKQSLRFRLSVSLALLVALAFVVVPLLMQHYVLLRRNLLYTAVTRGQRLVVLVGSQRALRRAVNEAGDLLRYTRLTERLRAILPS